MAAMTTNIFHTDLDTERDLLRELFPSAEIWHVRYHDDTRNGSSGCADTSGHIEEEVLNAAADHSEVTVIHAQTPNGLPDWAAELARQCPGYRFAQCDVFRGRSVAAVRITPGTGVHVVISSDEAEMRQALGMPDTPPSDADPVCGVRPEHHLHS